MSSLFKIEKELIDLRNMLEVEEEFADDSPEKEILEQQLEIKQEELSTKAEGYLHVISQAEAQANMAVEELNRIDAFIRRKRNIAMRLKASLLQAVLLFGEEDSKGVKRLEFGTHTLSTRRSSSVNILDEEAVPDDCKLCDVTFKNLSVDIKNFLARRIQELPDSSGKEELIKAFQPGVKISKTLVKEKLNKDDEIEWAKIETKYGLAIK